MEKSLGSPELKEYHGNCHCGLFRFRLNIAPLTILWTCNCSICSRVSLSLAWSLICWQSRLYSWFNRMATCGSIPLLRSNSSLMLEKRNPFIVMNLQWEEQNTWSVEVPKISIEDTELPSSVPNVVLRLWRVVATLHRTNLSESMWAQLLILGEHREWTHNLSQARMLEDIDISRLEVRSFSGADIGTKYEPIRNLNENKAEDDQNWLYKGNCHCGSFQFLLRIPKLTKARVCNCSICTRVRPSYLHEMALTLCRTVICGSDQ